MTMRAVRILAVVLFGAVLLAGCTTVPNPTKTNPEPPRDARATLQVFFDVWQAEDEPALEKLLTPERRGITWNLEAVKRVEFGEITEGRDLAEEYWKQGNTGPGVAREDLAVFRADTTFYFELGQQGSVADGDMQAWMWILMRDKAGFWRVDDWGY